MLQKVKFAPGFNKQVTSVGGESQWVAGDMFVLDMVVLKK